MIFYVSLIAKLCLSYSDIYITAIFSAMLDVSLPLDNRVSSAITKNDGMELKKGRIFCGQCAIKSASLVSWQSVLLYENAQ
jgi:hypothetical protein